MPAPLESPAARPAQGSAPSDATARRARVGLTDHQDAAATNGGRFCFDCGAWLGSLGLEPTPQLFVAHLVEFFRDVRRLLKPTGTAWLNLGDSFYQNSQNSRGRASRDEHGLKPRDLVGVPWRTALALQADGWYVRSDLVWWKPNPVPEPARDRPVRAHEFLFLLTREPHYYYDAEAVREPAVSKPSSTPWPMPTIHGGKYERIQDPRVRAATKYARRDAPISTTRHMRSVLAIPSGLCRPSAFGMYTLRDGFARYAPRCTLACRSWRFASRFCP